MSLITATILTLVLLMLVGMLAYVVSFKERGVLHILFIALTCELIIWNVAVLVGNYMSSNPEALVFSDNFAYFGAALVPVTILALGLAYQKNFGGFSKVHLVFLVIPVLTLIMVFTNEYHHLFYQSYSPETGYVQGPYFYIYAVYSYLCLIIGMIYLCYASIKESGALSLQAVLVTLACVFPLATNIGYTLHVPGFYVYTTPVAFTFTIMLYLFAMFRYGFLKTIPVATRTVVNRISDCFTVVSKELLVLDYNKAFAENFLSTKVDKKKKKSSAEKLDRLLLEGGLSSEQMYLIAKDIEEVFELRKGKIAELVLEREEPVYYTIEYTPLTDRSTPLAVILLFKNVTQHVRDLEMLEKNQSILLERERLASLGQMIGGIAHNLKSPILAISGSVDQVQSLVSEYQKSVGDPDVTPEDHCEIAQDMSEWLEKVKVQLSYMSDIITTVKGQAAQLDEKDSYPFTISELTKRTQILMRHALTESGCSLKVDLGAANRKIINGDINSLVQVLDNIIDNAIQAYNGKSGQIELRAGLCEGAVRFAVTDHGSGIEPSTQKLLFKEMTTTKGKNGTGLGLYMSYSTIRGRFRGDMWFESRPGRTTFFIQVPLIQG